MDDQKRRVLERAAGTIVDRRSAVRAVLSFGHVPDVVATEPAADTPGPDADFARAMAGARAHLDLASRVRPSLFSRLRHGFADPRLSQALEALPAAEPYVGTAFDEAGVAWVGPKMAYLQTSPAARMCEEARQILGPQLSAALDRSLRRAVLAVGQIAGTPAGREVSSPAARPASPPCPTPPTRAGTSR